MDSECIVGKNEVQWTPEAAVTPSSQLPGFVDFLKQADLFEPFVEQAPLSYSNPNVPQVRDVLGTLLLGVLAAHASSRHPRTRFLGNPHLFHNHPH